MNFKKNLQTLHNGGVLAIPTDTVFGLACLASDPSAVEKVSKIKQRDESKHYVLQVSTIKMAKTLIDPSQYELLENIAHFWPGEITFIFKKKKSLPFTFLGETIAIRIPNHKTTLSLLAEVNQPLVVTSLNLSGEPPVLSSDTIPKSLLDQIDSIVTCTQTLSNIPSTIVDLSQSPPQILRQGNIEFDISLSLELSRRYNKPT